MSKRIWVIDTNVLISAALTSRGTCDLVIRAAVDGHIQLAWSASILAEYRVVLQRPKFRFSQSVIDSLLAIFSPEGQVVPIDAPQLPDRDDEAFLATALATRDQILITGNTADFPKNLYFPVKILSPKEAVDSLV